jgi:thioredoxin 1
MRVSEIIVSSARRNRVIPKGIILSAPLMVVMILGTFACSAQHQIYSETADAKAEVHEALATAAREHKRVLLDFGGNWCGDCKALEYYFHDPANASLLAQNYVVVDVNIGRYDRNQDLADKYQVPLKKGVPALAILDSKVRAL